MTPGVDSVSVGRGVKVGAGVSLGTGVGGMDAAVRVISATAVWTADVLRAARSGVGAGVVAVPQALNMRTAMTDSVRVFSFINEPPNLP
jgi:hypothetical protein